MPLLSVFCFHYKQKNEFFLFFQYIQTGQANSYFWTINKKKEKTFYYFYMCIQHDNSIKEVSDNVETAHLGLRNK